jgi:hypothetical protein
MTDPRYFPQGSAWQAFPEFLTASMADPGLAWLVSYPRTGSHHLRLVLERCTGRPLLPHTFLEPDPAAKPLLLHHHDRAAEMPHRPASVVYLFRAAPETVFSLLHYWMCPDPAGNDQGIVRYTLNYVRHLRKWLLEEDFTVRKTILRHEDLAAGGLEKALAHLGENIPRDRIAEALAFATKEEVAARTCDLEDSVYKNRVIAPEADYPARKAAFLRDKSDLILDTVREDPEVAVLLGV